MSGRKRRLTFTIADGQSVSGAIDISNSTTGGVSWASDAEGTTVTFQEQDDAGTWFDVLREDGTELEVTVAAGKTSMFTGDALYLIAAAQIIRVRSGTSGTPVAQTGDATCALLLDRA
jgi:hypothetical protein